MNLPKTLLPRAVLVGLVLALLLAAIPAQAAKPIARPAISLGAVVDRTELKATVHAKAKLTRLELRIDNKKVQPWVKAHAGWKYTVKFPLDKISIGTHTAKLKVWNKNNHTAQRQWNFQKLAALALTVDKTAIQPGEKVLLSGQGFTPGTTVMISMGGVNTGAHYGSATADQNGSFTVEVMLDRYPNGSPLHAGTITLLAHNANGSEKSAVELNVMPAPAVSLDKSSIKPGEQVRMTGTGFTPGAAISVSLGGPNTGAGGNYGSVTADGNGTFALTLHLAQFPDGSPLHAGTVILVAHTPDSQEKATAQLQIQADPSISLNRTAIKAGEKVTVSGKGFTPGVTVWVALGAPNTGAGGNYGSAVADSTGRFTVDVVPARFPNGLPLTSGTIVLMAHTADFGEKAGAQLQVLPAPTIALDRTSIQPGDRVVVTGSGFSPGVPVIISAGWNTVEVGGNYGSTWTDAFGRFTVSVAPDRYPNGLPLQDGTIVLVAHTATWNESAAAWIQVLNRAPYAPSNLIITGVSKAATSAEPTTVGLQWRDNASNETGFRIQATFTRMYGGSDTQSWNVGPNVTNAKVTFTAGGINPITKACFTVTAFNGQGSSPPSNEVCQSL